MAVQDIKKITKCLPMLVKLSTFGEDVFYRSFRGATTYTARSEPFLHIRWYECKCWTCAVSIRQKRSCCVMKNNKKKQKNKFKKNTREEEPIT